VPDSVAYIAAILSLAAAVVAALTAWRARRAVEELQSKFRDIVGSPDINDPLEAQEIPEGDAEQDDR
jgi:hypothetical protein